MGRDYRKWNKSQRMQMKAFICVLGLLLLLILLIARIVLALLHKKEPEPGPEPPVHVPVIEEITNAWIMEIESGDLLIFRDGKEESYPYSEGFVPDAAAREQIADVEVTDGAVTKLQVKTEKLNGKILSADADAVEVEGYGQIPLAADYKGYRIYGALSMCTSSDLAFGYDFADLVMENGKICGILMCKNEAMENIRVLIKTSDYAGIFHESLTVTSDMAFTLEYGTYDDPVIEHHEAGEEILVEPDSSYLADGRMKITPDALTGRIILKNVNRSQGVPSYRGHMELEKTQEGIVAVNELPLEEYLYCVVPSEMPASYPAEALKAQAVCARTYAYGHMQRAGYPQYGAHVDDSTSYQVYNNILEQESTTTAVKESFGQLLYTEGGDLAGTYYYSTSCGVGTDANVWKTTEAPTLTYLRSRAVSSSGEADETIGEELQDEKNFEAFIRAKNADDFEVSESWYRWSYQVKKLDPGHMYENLKKRYEANEKLVLTLDKDQYVSASVKEFTEVTDLYVESRGVGGVCDELIIETDSGTYKVISEHNIRYVLNDGGSKVMRQDGKAVDSPNLLPSGFFVVDPVKEKKKVTGYTITGGGFGHGVGMSQNGARNMALYGMTSDDILTFFFGGCEIRNIYN